MSLTPLQQLFKDLAVEGSSAEHRKARIAAYQKTLICGCSEYLCCDFLKEFIDLELTQASVDQIFLDIQNDSNRHMKVYIFSSFAQDVIPWLNEHVGHVETSVGASKVLDFVKKYNLTIAEGSYKKCLGLASTEPFLEYLEIIRNTILLAYRDVFKKMKITDYDNKPFNDVMSEVLSQKRCGRMSKLLDEIAKVQTWDGLIEMLERYSKDSSPRDPSKQPQLADIREGFSSLTLIIKDALNGRTYPYIGEAQRNKVHIRREEAMGVEVMGVEAQVASAMAAPVASPPYYDEKGANGDPPKRVLPILHAVGWRASLLVR